MNAQKLMTINFIERRIALARKFHYELKDAFKTFSNDEVIKIIKKNGYIAKYIRRDNFFEITEKDGNFEFGFNIILKGGFGEFVFDVTHDEKPVLDYCGSWAALAIKSGYDDPIRKPVFRNYEDLQEILTEAFSIYEDFKRELKEDKPN